MSADPTQMVDASELIDPKDYNLGEDCIDPLVMHSTKAKVAPGRQATPFDTNMLCWKLTGDEKGEFCEKTYHPQCKIGDRDCTRPSRDETFKDYKDWVNYKCYPKKRDKKGTVVRCGKDKTQSFPLCPAEQITNKQLCMEKENAMMTRDGECSCPFGVTQNTETQETGCVPPTAAQCSNMNRVVYDGVCMTPEDAADACADDGLHQEWSGGSCVCTYGGEVGSCLSEEGENNKMSTDPTQLVKFTELIQPSQFSMPSCIDGEKMFSTKKKVAPGRNPTLDTRDGNSACQKLTGALGQFCEQTYHPQCRIGDSNCTAPTNPESTDAAENYGDWVNYKCKIKKQVGGYVRACGIDETESFHLCDAPQQVAIGANLNTCKTEQARALARGVHAPTAMMTPDGECGCPFGGDLTTGCLTQAEQQQAALQAELQVQCDDDDHAKWTDEGCVCPNGGEVGRCLSQADVCKQDGRQEWTGVSCECKYGILNEETGECLTEDQADWIDPSKKNGNGNNALDTEGNLGCKENFMLNRWGKQCILVDEYDCTENKDNTHVWFAGDDETPGSCDCRYDSDPIVREKCLTKTESIQQRVENCGDGTLYNVGGQLLHCETETCAHDIVKRINRYPGGMHVLSGGCDYVDDNVVTLTTDASSEQLLQFLNGKSVVLSDTKLEDAKSIYDSLPGESSVFHAALSDAFKEGSRHKCLYGIGQSENGKFHKCGLDPTTNACFSVCEIGTTTDVNEISTWDQGAENNAVWSRFTRKWFESGPAGTENHSRWLADS